MQGQKKVVNKQIVGDFGSKLAVVDMLMSQRAHNHSPNLHCHCVPTPQVENAPASQQIQTNKIDNEDDKTFSEMTVNVARKDGAEV